MILKILLEMTVSESNSILNLAIISLIQQMTLFCFNHSFQMLHILIIIEAQAYYWNVLNETCVSYKLWSGRYTRSTIFITCLHAAVTVSWQLRNICSKRSMTGTRTDWPVDVFWLSTSSSTNSRNTAGKQRLSASLEFPVPVTVLSRPAQTKSLLCVRLD